MVLSSFSALKSTGKKVLPELLAEVGKMPIKDLIQKHGNNAVNDLKSRFDHKFSQDGGNILNFQQRESPFFDTSNYKDIKENVKVKSIQSIAKIRSNNSKKTRKRKSSSISKSKKQQKKKNLKQRVLDIFNRT